MKGEYFIMNNASLRRVFSLLLAVMMVCALLPTVAFAENTAEPQDGNGGEADYANSSVPLTLNISSYGAPFYNPTKGTHDVSPFKFFKYINRSDVGSDNPKDCSATAHFVGSNETGWQLYVKVKIDNYEADLPQNAWIYNMDMSAATGNVTFGLSFNTAGGTSTYISISGGTALPSTAPSAPTEDDIINNNILGGVTVECTNADVQHGSKSYPLTKESITSITEPVYDSNAGQYSCMVTVSSTSYVHQFDHDKGGVHTPDDKTKTIQLLYYADAWHGPSGDPSVSSILFKVACTEKPEPPKAPDAPSHDELSKLIGDITVNCTNDAATHAPKSKGYALISGSYTPSEVAGDAENGYTYTVTIQSEKYVNQFDTDTGSAHTPKDGEATVVLEYKDKAWAVKRGTPVSFNVACVTEITPPTAPTFEQLPEIKVTVHCVTTGEHKDATWSLMKDSYEVGKVELKNDVYTCILTVKAEKYVDDYSTATYGVGKHELNDDAAKDIVLTWDGQKWAAEKNSVSFNVKCSLYTVTYTDGVKNKVIFKDDVHENLAYGSDTPKFTGGTPKRTGYTFTGWSPKVADKVTGNVTYVAQWKSNSSKDNVPKTGDGEVVTILGSVLMFSFCGAAAVCVYDRKRRQG